MIVYTRTVNSQTRGEIRHSRDRLPPLEKQMSAYETVRAKRKGRSKKPQPRRRFYEHYRPCVRETGTADSSKCWRSPAPDFDPKRSGSLKFGPSAIVHIGNVPYDPEKSVDSWGLALLAVWELCEVEGGRPLRAVRLPSKRHGVCVLLVEMASLDESTHLVAHHNPVYPRIGRQRLHFTFAGRASSLSVGAHSLARGEILFSDELRADLAALRSARSSSSSSETEVEAEPTEFPVGSLIVTYDASFSFFCHQPGSPLT